MPPPRGILPVPEQHSQALRSGVNRSGSGFLFSPSCRSRGRVERSVGFHPTRHSARRAAAAPARYSYRVKARASVAVPDISGSSRSGFRGPLIDSRGPSAVSVTGGGRRRPESSGPVVSAKAQPYECEHSSVVVPYTGCRRSDNLTSKLRNAVLMPSEVRERPSVHRCVGATGVSWGKRFRAVFPRRRPKVLDRVDRGLLQLLEGDAAKASRRRARPRRARPPRTPPPVPGRRAGGGCRTRSTP